MILGSSRPAPARRRRAIATTSGRLVDTGALKRASVTASSSSSIRAFGGSAHCGSGIRSILRRFSRSETTRAASRVVAEPLDGQRGGAVEGLVPPSVASRRAPRSAGPSRSTSNTSDPRLSAQEDAARAGRAGAELAVDVAHVRAADDDQVDPGGAQGFDECPERERRRPAGRARPCRPSRRRSLRTSCRSRGEEVASRAGARSDDLTRASCGHCRRHRSCQAARRRRTVCSAIEMLGEHGLACREAQE